MKSIIKSTAAAGILAAGILTAGAQTVRTENVDIHISGDYLSISADLVLDSLRLGANRQIFITPVIESADTVNGQRERDNLKVLPSVLVNGRNMHVSYERGVLRSFKEMKEHEIGKEVQRHNGTRQRVPYSVRTPFETWMRGRATSVTFVYDSCGCGVRAAETISRPYTVFQNPIRDMMWAMIIPEVEEIPIQTHEGRARVQFEVDRTELHVDPFVCRNGQRLDNREQIRIIDDSVRYALTDPNVEISSIELCGYASPESPYLHNVELADGRTKALAQYLAQRYNLPQDRVTYSSVPENWKEFREMVVGSDRLTERQRQQLLRLIDEPAYTPEQWDRKEWLLKTEPPYADLYHRFILPEWFPKLRATTFAVHTRLKNLEDKDLKEVIKTTPEKMSLNQMYRVARMYPEDSEEFDGVMQTALKYYPRDQIAITNAASAAVAREDYDRARQLIARGMPTAETDNLLGIIATAEGNYSEARGYFEKAKAAGNANAARNLEKLR